MNECNKKFQIIMLAFVVTLIYLVTINSNNYGDSNIVAILQLVSAHRGGDGEERVTQKECANIIDKVKGLDAIDISRLLAENNNGGGGQEIQGLRVSLIMCGALSDLDNALKRDDLEKLDPIVIAVLGPDIIQNLIRR